MWKKLKSRGAETVEYAIVLACIAAFGLMFSDNLTHTLETLMGKTGSIITNGSTNKGDKDDETDKDDTDKNDPNVAINNKNMDWLKGTFFDAMTNENNADRIKNYIGGYSDKTDIGLTNAGGLENSSWAFAGYRNESGDLCYGVSIYNNEKNGGQSLKDQKVGASITTDIYTVNTTTGKVELYKENVTTQTVGKNDKGTVNVIRGDYK